MILRSRFRLDLYGISLIIRDIVAVLGDSDEFLDSDRVANVYVTSDADAKSRISSLNEFSKINLNETRRAGDNEDGDFNECKLSDQEFDDEIASINSKDNDDDADDDDD